MKEIELQYRHPPDLLQEGEIPSDIRTEELVLNMGPQHPSTHGVLRVILQTDGELVLKATPYMGYLHRCAEKIAEMQRSRSSRSRGSVLRKAATAVSPSALMTTWG